MRKSVCLKTADSHCFVYAPPYARRHAWSLQAIAVRVPSNRGIPGHRHARFNLFKPSQVMASSGTIVMGP